MPILTNTATLLEVCSRTDLFQRLIHRHTIYLKNLSSFELVVTPMI